MALMFKFHSPELQRWAARARRAGLVMLAAKKLKAFVDSLDDVEDKYHELYVEEKVGDKTRFRLDAEGVEDVTGLKNTVATLRRENGELKKKTKPLEDLGEDEVDDLEDIITAGRAAIESKKTGKPAPEVETAVASATRKSEKKIKELETERDALNDALNRYVIDDGARMAIKAQDGSERLLLPHVKGMLGLERVVEGDKVRYERRVYEGEGTERAVRTGTDGKPLTVDAAVAELRDNDDFADAFRSRLVPGSGDDTERERGMPNPPRTTGTRQRERGTVAPSAKDAKRATQDYTL